MQWYEDSPRMYTALSKLLQKTVERKFSSKEKE